MFDGDYDPHNPFPHDGEGDESCTGYGCNCDERNYENSTWKGTSGSSSSGGGILIAFIVALIIGYGINELLGAIIMIGLIFYMMIK